MEQAEVVRRHLDHLRLRNLRPNTILLRRRVLSRLAASLDGRSLLEATPADIGRFLDRLTEPRSRYTELTQLTGFYKWATGEGLTSRDPTVGLDRPRRIRGLPRPIPDDLLAKAFANCSDRVRPILYLAAYAGLRACEIAPLRGEALLYQERIIVIEEAKGGQPRSVPMAPVLHEMLPAMLPSTGWCFSRRDGKQGPISAHLASTLANNELHKLGITHTLHSLRHWFGTNAQRVGHDVRATQELLGHASLASTQLYTWVDPGRLAEIVAALPTL